ncbi:MAG: DMT family transporter [Microcella pacifica]
MLRSRSSKEPTAPRTPSAARRPHRFAPARPSCARARRPCAAGGAPGSGSPSGAECSTPPPTRSCSSGCGSATSRSFSVLTALYPAGTILLAAVVLRERIARLQWVGLVLALAASAMLSLA